MKLAEGSAAVVVVSSRTEPDVEGVVDVTLFSALDAAEIRVVVVAVVVGA